MYITKLTGYGLRVTRSCWSIKRELLF